MPYAEFCNKLCTLPLSQRFSHMSSLKMPQGQAHEASLSLGGIPQRWCKWAQHNQLHSRHWPDEIAGQSTSGSLMPGRQLGRFMAESFCQSVLGISHLLLNYVWALSWIPDWGQWRNEEQTHRHTLRKAATRHTDTPSAKLQSDEPDLLCRRSHEVQHFYKAQHMKRG